MTLKIFLDVLQALTPITDSDEHGNVIGAQALALKQSLELLAKNPADAQQLANMIAMAVAGNAESLEQAGMFVAACLTGGKRAAIPQASARFGQMAARVASQ